MTETKVRLQTALHNVGRDTATWGTTPMEDWCGHPDRMEEFPSIRPKNALEIIGEGILLLLASEPNQLSGGEESEVRIILPDGPNYRITRKQAAALAIERY